MLELEDKLSMYGISIEEVLEKEEQHYEYMKSFTENELYQKVVGELTKDIFDRFLSSDEEVAKRAHYEGQALKKIVEKLKNFETEYLKVQAIKEADAVAEAY